jgi:hypothetical protein
MSRQARLIRLPELNATSGLELIRAFTMLCCMCTIYTLFQVTFLLTVTSKQCWSLDEFWQHKTFNKPFFAFALVILLLFFWALIELMCISKAKNKSVITLASICVIVFVLCFAPGYYTFKQMLQIDNGEIRKEDYLFKTQQLQYRVTQLALWPNYSTLYKQIVCDNGWNLYDLSEEQQNVIDKKFNEELTSTVKTEN